MIALGGLVYLVPSLRRRGSRLSGGPSPWGSRRSAGARWCGPIATPAGLFREARALLLAEGHRCWSAFRQPRALVRAGSIGNCQAAPSHHRFANALSSRRPGAARHGRHKILPGSRPRRHAGLVTAMICRCWRWGGGLAHQSQRPPAAQAKSQPAPRLEVKNWRL